MTAARLVVERAQLLAQAGQIDELVNRPQQMVRGDIPLEAELVKARLLRTYPVISCLPHPRKG